MNHHHHSIHGVNPQIQPIHEDQFMVLPGMKNLNLNLIQKDLNLDEESATIKLARSSAAAANQSSHAYDDLAALVNEFIEEDHHGSSASRFHPILLHGCRMAADSNHDPNYTCNHREIQSITGMHYGSASSVLRDDVYDELIQAMEGLVMMASINSSDKGEKEEAELRRDVMEAFTENLMSLKNLEDGEDFLNDDGNGNGNAYGNGNGNAEIIKNYRGIKKKKKKEKKKSNGGGPVHKSGIMLNYGVMRQLRAMGYNAAICKSRWENAAGSLPSGNYEYIDVIVSSGRIFVDIDFRAQFELARASKQYNTLLKMVPCIFVGRGERLKAIIKAMSEGAKLSLKIMGMHLPPWRKHSYLQAKWFSSYKRTTISSTTFDSGYANPKPTHLGSISLEEPLLSTRLKVEIEDFYGYSKCASKPTLSSSSACLLVPSRMDKLITSGWQPPALVNSSRLALEHETPRRKVSALAHALRQHSQANNTGSHALKQHRATPTRAIAC